jgi:ATP-dependent helicase/nuclease subunit A
MNSLTPSQQRAIHADGNVLVVAGAGTGKTSTLTHRCLHVLEDGGSLENVLMVTFTESAAAEMRARIREALLGRLRTAEEEDSDARLREHFERQTTLLDTALIVTLHSFCLRLVREHFYDLEIDPAVMVLSEPQTQPLIRQTLDTVFERHYGGQTALDHAVRKVVRLHGRVSDDRIRELILKLHRYSQSLASPEDWLATQEALFLQDEPARWREWWMESVIRSREYWLEQFTPFAGNPAVDLSITALKALPANPAPGEIALALRAIRSAYVDPSHWPRGSVGKVRDPLETVFEEAKFLASLAPSGGIDPLLEDWNLTRGDMLALLSLTREFTEDYSRAKREMGGVDFADLEQFALRVLRDPRDGAATPAALQWRRQFHHVLVDEYQDINAAQDAILGALSRDGAAANRFLVGDVKQSIYRFRLADPSIFRGYEKRWDKGEACSQRISLAVNFRSRRGILDFVNPLFRTLMREDLGGVVYEDLVFGDAAGRVAAGDPGGGSPPVELHLIAKKSRQAGGEEDDGEAAPGTRQVADLLGTEREARLVALRLRELVERQYPVWDRKEKRYRAVWWGDMAVLLRSPAGRVEAYAKEFAALDVPVEAPRGGFFESLENRDLICLLKLLDNPMQDVPLLAVLRSPLVGMSLSELAEIRAEESSGNRVRNFWFAAKRFVQCAADSSPACRKLRVFFAQLDRWRQSIRRTSLSECLETVLAETHYETLLTALSRGEQQAANVRRLLALAREFDPYRRQGLFRFLRFIEDQEEIEIEPAVSDREAVKVLSIHRSKGLEFPVVAVAGLGSPFNLRDLYESILLDEKHGLCPKIRRPEAEKYYPSLPHWLAQRRQRAELLGEELRLLYVAMTRARDALLLTGAVSGKGDPQWGCGETRELSDRELLSVRCPLDWLRLWLPRVTRAQEWNGDREGQSDLLQWKIYDEDDARLALQESVTAASPPVTPPVSPPDLPGLLELRARLSRAYPFQAATEQSAKTNVTELRRLNEPDEMAAPAFRRSIPFASLVKRVNTLSAAEIGIAHHRFLERVCLSRVGSLQELRNEAARLREENWLSEPGAAALDFEALARFWQSDLGRKVAVNAVSVRRELQFTARFLPEELKSLAGSPSTDGQTPNIEQPTSNLQRRTSNAQQHTRQAPIEGRVPGEGWDQDFVVVQGVVDLAVILPEELWLMDFKTDTFQARELADKVRTHEPQLKLYARALQRIYERPVTECCLYFLSQSASAQITI